MRLKELFDNPVLHGVLFGLSAIGAALSLFMGSFLGLFVSGTGLFAFGFYLFFLADHYYHKAQITGDALFEGKGRLVSILARPPSSRWDDMSSRWDDQDYGLGWGQGESEIEIVIRWSGLDHWVNFQGDLRHQLEQGCDQYFKLMVRDLEPESGDSDWWRNFFSLQQRSFSTRLSS